MDEVTVSERRRADLLSGAQRSMDTSGKGVADLLDRYYRDALLEDLVQRQPHDLLGAALGHCQTADRRMPGEAVVRAFTPSIEADGWSTGCTVIQIVVDDTPFVVDSVTSEISRLGHEIRMLLHPQMSVSRGRDGRLLDPCSVAEAVTRESWVYVEIPRLADANETEALVENLRRVLADVQVAVADWQPMTARALEIAAGLASGSGRPGVDALEAAQLLEWMAADHFLFLGYRQYDLRGDTTGSVLEPAPGTGLGVLRKPSSSPGRRLAGLPAKKARERRRLIITKANSRSTVHRSSYLDYVGIKTFDAKGRVTGEHRFIGLFTSRAYSCSVVDIPFLRAKIGRIITLSGFSPDSHSGRDLMSVLEAYPRDGLFQAKDTFVADVARRVVASRHHRQTSLFLRKDEYGRFMSCLVFLPRDRYDSEVRQRVERLLVEALDGASAEYTALVTDSPLAMIHYVVRMAPGTDLPDVEVGDLEGWVRTAARTWESDWALAMEAEFGETAGAQLSRRWRDGFDDAYKASYHPRVAAVDIRHLEELPDKGMAASLYEQQGSAPAERRLKLYCSHPVGLTRVMPVLLDFGLEVTDERPYQVTASGEDVYHVLDFGVRAPSGDYWSSGSVGRRVLILEAFSAVWYGLAESDSYNQLVGGAGLSWRQVACLRAIGGYLAQTTHYSRRYLESALTENPTIAARLIDLFECRFDPARTWTPGDERAEAEQAIAESILEQLNRVPSIDHDRIVRYFITVIRACLRTNYFSAWVADDQHGPTTGPGSITLKLDSQAIPHLPAPKPVYEVWVYSPSVEGVHLRFGKVARGGLRWSDRREDFRTEVLGLVKAQIVKNAVIVPTGAKGCFYPKNLPDPQRQRNEWLAQGRLAYYTFVDAMLSITDNLANGTVVHPDGVVRYDGDDTYLVVAADKGTATFSDLANEASRAHGFWLDDAFASGGSEGYDHKAMGITARGAWESVKRHFRELDVDPQRQDIRVVGIGDMSGDVFGNGMLQSRRIHLVAAFDHRHVFIDPTPDPEASFEERQRLFGMPASSWADYSPQLISAGGGVFPRSSKSITVTPQMRTLLPRLGDAARVTPAEMIRAILRAPVDLLWNGGIGTYVKASDELDADVGDHSNDGIRITGSELACRVVGEGGNLGASQRGRIEAALNGIRINTDAIDNSAGVELSDHEVNIKILLDRLVWDGQMTTRQRNELLADVAGEVASQVLRTNYEQNVLLGNARYLGDRMLPAHERLMRWLEDRVGLDRTLESLPNHDALAQRSKDGRGLTSPEFSVIVAYAKRAIKDLILDSDLPDDPWLEREVRDYFPARFAEFPEALSLHPLRREIIATRVANSLVNRGGITFAQRAMEETGASIPEIARAFVICRELFDLDSFVGEVETLDGVIDASAQSELYVEFRRLLDQGVRTLLDQPTELTDLTAAIDRYRPNVARVREHPRDLLADEALRRFEDRASHFNRIGVPEPLASRAAGLLDSASVLRICGSTTQDDGDVLEVSRGFFLLAAEVQMEALLALIRLLPDEARWDALARSTLREDLNRVVTLLTGQALRSTEASAPMPSRIAAWATQHSAALDRIQQTVAALLESSDIGVGPLWAILRELQMMSAAPGGQMRTALQEVGR